MATSDLLNELEACACREQRFGALGHAELLRRAAKEIERERRKVAAALDYVELHMSEDINANGQANDAMSLRMILEGRMP